MSPLDARRVQLGEGIRRDWEQVVARAAEARAVDPAAGPDQRSRVALALHHAYQAFETLLVRVERCLDLPERSGAGWHLSLLEEAAQPLPRLRPAVLPPGSFRDWKRLLDFRHFLRHAYAVELDASELSQNVEHLERTVRSARGGRSAPPREPRHAPRDREWEDRPAEAAE